MVAGSRITLGIALTALVVASPLRAAEAPIPDEVVRLRVDSTQVLDDGTLDVRFRAEIAPGWHVNAHEPLEAWLVPSVLEVETPEGWTVGDVRYPEPEEFRPAFAKDAPMLVWSGEVALDTTLQGETQGETTFLARLRYQACDDTRCLRPTRVEREFRVLPAGAAGAGTAGADAAAPGTASLGADVPAVERWLAEWGLMPTLLLVALGGLALNLTPCVYPLVSVTIAYFGGQGTASRGRAFALSTAYALGIAITFSALGLAAAFSGGLFGAWLQHAWVLIALAVVMLALAASNFGLWTLQAPTALVNRVGGSAAGVVGALAMGLTMGIVAAPCVGPFIVGLLVAVGAIGDPALGFALFFALAVGLGLPYVVLGAFAGSLARLPRSGEWLLWIEHLFGVVLVGMAIWFVHPLLPAHLVALFVPVFLVVSGLYLGFVDPAGSDRRGFRLLKGGVGVAAIALATWVGLPHAGDGSSIDWENFSPPTLAEAAAAGRPAIVDFRADWCLPCLEMEKTTFVDAEVARRAEGFAMLQADVTAMSPAHETLLEEHTVRGVPTTIFFDCAGRERERVIGYVGPARFAALMDESAEC